MSRRHAWLAFTAGGPALSRTLDTDPVPWQGQLTVLQGRWYDVDAPPQVAAVFVLQWLLQVPAHTAAHAAAAGPWRADLTALTFDLGSGLVPSRVRLTVLQPDAGRLADRQRDGPTLDVPPHGRLVRRVDALQLGIAVVEHRHDLARLSTRALANDVTHDVDRNS